MRKKSTIPWIVKFMRITLIQAMLAMVIAGVSLARDNYAQALLEKKVTVNFENTTVKKILTAIEKEASVRFAYSGSFVNIKEKTTLNVTNARLGDVLEKLLKSRHILYSVKDDYILLTQAENKQSVVESNRPAATAPTPLFVT